MFSNLAKNFSALKPVLGLSSADTLDFEFNLCCFNTPCPFLVYNLFNPLPDNKIIDCSKLKQIADDILECI